MSVINQLKSAYNNPSVRSVGMYTFTNFFSKAASFLLLFIFTNPLYITASENGLLSLFSNSMLFLMPFLSMGIVHSVSADYFKMEKKAFRDFFSTAFIMPVLVMLLSMIVLYVFRETLKTNYGFPYMFVWLIPLITFLIFCNEQLLSMARNNQEPQVYMKANISKTILELGISFLLVVYFAWRWQGRVAGVLAAYSILAVYAFIYFKQKGYLFGSIQKKYIRSELLYAVPIIALQASIFTMNASDKFFLSHVTDDNNETVGIYSIACIFASIINVLSMALLQYLFPKIFMMLSKADVDHASLKKHFLMYVAVMTAGTIALIVAMPVVYRFFINEKYHAALEYSYLLCIGMYIWSISYFFYSFLLYHKEKRKILSLSVCCIIISLVSHYYFIGKWNATGGAISYCVTYGLVCIITLLFTRSYWKMLFIQPEKMLNER